MVLWPENAHLLQRNGPFSTPRPSSSLHRVSGWRRSIGREIYKMKKLFRTLFLMLGIVSFALTITLCLHMPLVTAILPPEDAFPLRIFLASITASIGASLLWLGVSGELAGVRGGAIDLAVFYVGLTIFQFRSA